MCPVPFHEFGLECAHPTTMFGELPLEVRGDIAESYRRAMTGRYMAKSFSLLKP
jgi:hypothetical protein